MAVKKSVEGAPQPAGPEEERVLRSVLEAIRQVRFGYVQLMLQDGKVVQIDRLERLRLEQK